MGLRRLVYTSKSVLPISDRALLDLMHDARGYNAADGITGLLIHRGGDFFQLLEGEGDAIDDVWRRISADTRHHSIEIIDTREIDQRLFPQWSMEAVELERLAEAGLPGLSMNLSDRDNTALLVENLPGLAAWLAENL